MNDDEQLEIRLRTWLQREPTLPPARDRVAQNVLARVHAGPRGRRRWWLLGLREHEGSMLDIAPGASTPGAALVRPDPVTPTRRPLVAAAAAALVLVGGVLLMTAALRLTADRVPVAVPPATYRTDLLPPALVTQEVEPGVLRVLNDGIRDLTVSERFEGRDADGNPIYTDSLGIAVGADGTVWLHSRAGTFRLGAEDVAAGGITATEGFEHFAQVEVAPDGSLWAAGAGAGFFYRTFDGQQWHQQFTRAIDQKVYEYTDVAVGPDGTAWILRAPDDLPVDTLLRRDPDGRVTTAPSWTDAYDGPVARTLAVGPDGDVWLLGIQDAPHLVHKPVRTMLRFDGSSWEDLPIPAGLRDYEGWEDEGQSFDVGADGTLWAGVELEQVDSTDPGTDFLDRNSGQQGLARLDASGWTVFTAADGVPPWGAIGGWGYRRDLLDVAPDGSVWVNVPGGDFGEGAGLAHFDGVRWETYLSDTTVEDLAVTADGVVWVSAADHPGTMYRRARLGLYVILPKAAGE